MNTENPFADLGLTPWIIRQTIKHNGIEGLRLLVKSYQRSVVCVFHPDVNAPGNNGHEMKLINSAVSAIRSIGDTELQQLAASYCTELDAAGYLAHRHVMGLQNQIDSLSTEVRHLSQNAENASEIDKARTERTAQAVGILFDGRRKPQTTEDIYCPASMAGKFWTQQMRYKLDTESERDQRRKWRSASIVVYFVSPELLVCRKTIELDFPEAVEASLAFDALAQRIVADVPVMQTEWTSLGFVVGCLRRPAHRLGLKPLAFSEEGQPGLSQTLDGTQLVELLSRHVSTNITPICSRSSVERRPLICIEPVGDDLYYASEINIDWQASKKAQRILEVQTR